MVIRIDLLVTSISDATPVYTVLERVFAIVAVPVNYKTKCAMAHFKIGMVTTTLS